MADLLSCVRVGAVARNTFREALRNRAFVGLVAFSVAFILLSLALSEMAVVGQEARVVQSFGFFAISLAGAITAVVMGALLVYKEIERKTIYTIISKPIHRHEFIIGKLGGLVGLLVVQVVILGLVWAFVTSMQGGSVSVEHLKGLALIVLEISLVASVAVMFSAFSSPVLTGLFSFGVFVTGRLIPLMEEMLSSNRGLFVENDFARFVGEAAVMVLPDLSVFNVSQQVLLGVPVHLAYMGEATLYAAAYGVVFIVIAIWAFERRDFI
jgi:ABC-type transport system involved in multi-copper enzyme maturation permease subunit